MPALDPNYGDIEESRSIIYVSAWASDPNHNSPCTADLSDYQFFQLVFCGSVSFPRDKLRMGANLIPTYSTVEKRRSHQENQYVLN
jgi:hypothetical protein